MNSQTELRKPVSKDELLKLSRLYEKIASATKSSFFNWNQLSALEEISKAENWIYWSLDAPLAFVTFRIYPDRLEISALGTDPEKRQKGHAKACLNQLKLCATAQRLPIWLEVHAENVAALDFYKCRGFVLVHRRKDYYADRGDALVMTWTDGSS